MEQVKISELNEIVAVVTNYTEGCKKGDTAQMRKAFDKGAVMYGYLNGQLYDGSIDNLYGAVDALGGDDRPYRRQLSAAEDLCTEKPGGAAKNTGNYSQHL